MFFAFSAGRPTHGERAAIARTKATIFIGLLFPFPGRIRRKLRRHFRLLARDIQAGRSIKIGQMSQYFSVRWTSRSCLCNANWQLIRPEADNNEYRRGDYNSGVEQSAKGLA